jgi:zinc/manganese transport system substrate-binding protein
MRIVLIVAMLINIALAKIEIATTYRYIEDITHNIGGDLVNIKSLSKPKEDPHFVMARPSLIAKLRNADLLIINGGHLEIGWLPPLIKRANNRRVFDRSDGFLDLSHSINMLDVHESVSRADGDVHPDGNPHFILDPYNVPIVAKSIADKLSSLDSSNKEKYQSNYKLFKSSWDLKLLEWDKKMKKLEGRKVIEYHKIFDYLLKRYKIELLDTIDPIPGVTPTSKHIMELIKKIKKQDSTLLIMHDVYHNKKASKLIASKTGVSVIDIPHDVDSLEGADSIENLFNTIVNSITK